MSHTPGPWHINGYAYTRDDAAPTGRRVYLCNPDSDVCEGYSINAANVQVCEVKRHSRLDDARLIAAAPELLSALQGILRSAGYESGEVEPTLRELTVGLEYLDSARAAIAKATT